MVDFFHNLSIFSGSPPEVVRLYAYLSRREHFRPGDLLAREGGAADRVFIIESGEVEIFMHDGDRQVIIQHLSAETINYFGELALLASFAWVFSARALSEVFARTITREAFGKVMSRYPERYPMAVERIVRLRVERMRDQHVYMLSAKHRPVEHDDDGKPIT